MATRYLIVLILLLQILYNSASNEMTIENKLQDLMKNISYRETIRPSDNFGSKSNGPHQVITIKVQMIINELGKISETENDYFASLTLEEKWFDKRLIMNESFEFLSLTYLKSKIWIPDLYFYNMKSLLTTTPNPSSMWLYPNGLIIYSTTIRLKFYCHMNLWKFPLDTQRCHMELGSYGYPTQDLKLEWWHHISKITDNVRLVHANSADFLEPKLSIRVTNSSRKLNGLFSILKVNFDFKRNFLYHLIFTFLPSALIVSVSWVSFLIDYKAAPARVPFCLLTLLSIMTQWNNINSSLPRLSYLKSIDVWMFICLTFIILSLFEYAIVNRMAVLQETNKLPYEIEKVLKKEFCNLIELIKLDTLDVVDGKTKLKDNINNNDNGQTNDTHCLKPLDVDRISSYLFPLMFICVNVIFWSFLCSVK